MDEVSVPVLVGALALTGALGGCRQEVFEPVNNALIATVRLQGNVQVFTKADLLFVVDDSVSMASKQPKVAAALPALIAQLQALDPPVDYRLGVMTFSVEERFGPCDPDDPTAPAQCSAQWGQDGYACEPDDECVKTFPPLAGQLVAAPGNPTVLDSATMSAAQIEQLFTENVEVGTQGSQQEQPLRGVKIGLTTGALQGFLRDDSRLIVFMASDSDDCSDSTDTLMAEELVNGQVIDNCALQSANGGSQLDSVSAWLKMFESLTFSTGEMRPVTLGAAVGLAPGTTTPGTCTDPVCAANCQGSSGQAACGQQCAGSLDETTCMAQCTQQCVDWCGSQLPGRRIATAVNALSGPLSSICDPDFGPAVAQLAKVLGIPTSINLPAAPEDQRLFFFTVTRGGQQIQCEEGQDFTLDLTATPPAVDIVQTGACRLMPDDQWQITYIVPTT